MSSNSVVNETNNPTITPTLTNTVTPKVTDAIMPTVSVTALPSLYPLDWGNRVPGSIEDIDILATPLTSGDSVAMLRIYVENGEVLDFSSAGFMALGSCVDNRKFTSERVCVDIAKPDPFVAGEKIATIKIKWGENGRLYKEQGDGYYNGTDVSLTIPSDMLAGKVAGLTTSSTTDTSSDGFFTEGVVLIAVSAFILFAAMIGFYLVLSKNKQKTNVADYNNSNNGIKVLIGLSVFALAGGTVFVAYMVANKNQAPESTSALTPTPIYITVTVYPSNTLTPTTTATVTPTLTTTTTPTVTLTTTPVITTPPMPTPITDNIPLMCGALDVNADRILNYIDYQAMIVVYNHECYDSYPHQGCGGKDTNEDGVVNFIDLHYLVNHQYPTYVNCTRY